MIRLFTGWDHREAVGWGVFTSSVIRRCREPVSIVPLHGTQGDGSNAFTYARFWIADLCQYEGWAIFADGCDMVCLADLADLWALRDERFAVQVVKHAYATKDKVKYRGTEMECPNIDYKGKNWSSLMLINCGHPKALRLTPATQFDVGMHRFDWLDEREDVGSLSREWNWICDEFGENSTAKILHWTRGIPAFTQYRITPMADVWFTEYMDSQRGLQKEALCQPD